jgi:hypothetical protein
MISPFSQHLLTDGISPSLVLFPFLCFFLLAPAGTEAFGSPWRTSEQTRTISTEINQIENFRIARTSGISSGNLVSDMQIAQMAKSERRTFTDA